MEKLRIVIFGSMDWLNQSLNELTKNKIKPLKVFLPNDRNNSNSIKLIKKLKLDFEIIESINKDSTKLEKLNPDLVLCFAFPEIFKKKILSIAKIGNINFHSSDLPKFRGRHPVNWAMIKGEEKIGICAHLMNEKIDLGDVLIRDFVYVERDDLIKDVMKKLSCKMKKMALKVIDQARSNSFYKTSQNLELATYDPKREEQDSKINWKDGSFKIHRFINALGSPYPNAYTYIKKKKKICKFSQSFIGDQIGRVIAKTTDGRLVISTSDGIILVKSQIDLKIGDLLK